MRSSYYSIHSQLMDSVNVNQQRSWEAARRRRIDVACREAMEHRRKLRRVRQLRDLFTMLAVAGTFVALAFLAASN